MGQAHKHAEVIKAWADGKPIQSRILNSDGDWFDCVGPENPSWHELIEYRIKPEAPKWPQTRMGDDELIAAWERGAEGLKLTEVANAAIARSCEDGDMVPLKQHNQAISSARDGMVTESVLEKVAFAVHKACITAVIQGQNAHHVYGPIGKVQYTPFGAVNSVDILRIIASVKEGKNNA